MPESFTVGWGTLSLINAAIAQTKNRSAANSLLLSLFLGPIATALVVLLEQYEPTPEANERMKKTEKTPKGVNIVLIALILVVIFVFLGRSYLQ